ncbi:MAG: radical SAM protein [Nitrospinae bacterium CG11_big_fil_rev_8_21_14_0_20_45_15]|nr:MAG: radical SAM protein [Nitrospinae bacterium CG11_big_fil_rev_8_21_14_0_20_45_15]
MLEPSGTKKSEKDPEEQNAEKKSCSGFKVLLIYPNFPLANLLLPAGVSIISAVLKKHDIDVRLFDTTLYTDGTATFDDVRTSLLQLKQSKVNTSVAKKLHSPMDDFKKLLDEYQPDLVGVSLLADTFSIGVQYTREAHQRGIPVIAGGVYPTFSPEEVAIEESIDFLCLGEGENTMLDLCKALASGESYEHIPNLWIKQADGNIIKNPLGPLMNMNDLPYADYSLFEKDRFFRPMQGQVLRMLPIELQRGCPYQCTFCEDPSLNVIYRETDQNYHRIKSPQRVIDEIKYFIEKYEVNYVYFNAETFFAMPPKNFQQLAELYTKEIHLPFWIQTRPETITEERVKMLKDMNISNINIGLEHGNEEFRSKVLKRRMSNTRIIGSLKILEEADIPVTVNNIMGYPDETRELIFDTIELNRTVKSATINAYLYNPYKGTELYDVAYKKGYLPEDSDEKIEDISLSTSAFAYFKAILKMPTISREELLGLQKTFVLYAKLPRHEFPRIKIAEQNNAVGKQTFEDLSNEYAEIITGKKNLPAPVLEYLTA